MRGRGRHRGGITGTQDAAQPAEGGPPGVRRVEASAPLQADPQRASKELVPPEVLLYLLYRQSFVTAPATLEGEVSQALALLNGSTTGSLANALLSGWGGHGYSAKEAWCIPLICAMGDDAL